nr:O-phosphoserine--tRNA ligase [Candidatus Sigynarchaeota archaeon]
MVTFDTKQLLERAKRNYEKTWEESAALLDKTGSKFKLDPTKGTSHPVYHVIQEARNALITLGFEELVLPIFVDEDEIYKEYGSEAALILDRLFYTAELPRPDIGISSKKIEQIKEIIPGFEDIDGLQALLRSYKKGEIEADNFLEAMCEKLGLSPTGAAYVVDQVFPE